MTQPTDMQALETFAGLAEQFCVWAESAVLRPDEELQISRRFASRLYAAALDLPEGEPHEEDARGGGLTHAAAVRRFGALPITSYATCDPLEVPCAEPMIGDVSDDLADTYADLRRGLVLYRAGHRAAAAWEWSFSFRHHWGDHVVGALQALQAYATKP